MKKVIIIGAGGVGGVVAHKCAQVPGVFGEICLASRTKDKCDNIARRIEKPVRTEKIDAMDVRATAALIKDFGADIVINTALPYQDLAIMEACLEARVDYLDTANYESPDDPDFRYKEQWEMDGAFREKGLMALLGSGFDPGVTNVFCAYALKHCFDEIRYIDIMDCNAGEHGHPFATNFNPEINIREITKKGKYWEEGEWKYTEPLSVHKTFDFPEIGPREMYLLYHEEEESLVKNIKGLKRIRFWMTFGEQYLTHLRVLQNVGMTRIDEVDFEGHKIVPLKFLKAVLPEPSSLGENYRGKTNIGCMMEGVKDGRKKKVYIYNVCDHAECYKEVKSQAISYTTGVPAMTGAMLMLTGEWRGKGVFNMEQLDPDPFMDKLKVHGLPWIVVED
jgi:saccharopine dehydrogenase (NAD+, L-lysine-forming)